MTRTVRVIIAEDEPEINRSITDIVASDPLFDVLFSAYNGKDVLDYLSLSTTLPDIILTDIRMPGMDGLALLEHIHSNYPSIKTVVLSGYSNFTYAQKAIQFGVSDYILKPVNASSCIETLKNASSKIWRTSVQFDLSIALNQHDPLLPNHQNHLYLYAWCPTAFPFAMNLEFIEQVDATTQSIRRLCDSKAIPFYISNKNSFPFLLCELHDNEQAIQLENECYNILYV